MPLEYSKKGELFEEGELSQKVGLRPRLAPTARRRSLHTVVVVAAVVGARCVWRRNGAAALAPANVAGAPYARRAQEWRDLQRPPCQLRQLDEHLPPRRDLHLARRRPLLEAARTRRSGQQHQVPADTGRGARCPAPSRSRHPSRNQPGRGPPLHTLFAQGHRPTLLRPVPGARCSGHPRLSRPALCACQVIDMVPEEDLSTKGGKGKGKGKGKGEGKGEGKGKGRAGGRGGDGGRGGGRASGRGGGRGYN